MKVVVIIWDCTEMAGLRHGDTIEISNEKLLEIFKSGYDVALCHSFEHRSKKKGGSIENGYSFLMVDEAGGKFRCR